MASAFSRPKNIALQAGGTGVAGEGACVPGEGAFRSANVLCSNNET